jgi:hypothetical protein
MIAMQVYASGEALHSLGHSRGKCSIEASAQILQNYCGIIKPARLQAFPKPSPDVTEVPNAR